MVVLIVTALAAAALGACAGMSREVYRCCVQGGEVMNIERDRKEQVAVRKDEERKRERLGEESREKTEQKEALERDLGSKKTFKDHKKATEEDFKAASQCFGRDFYKKVNIGVVGLAGTGKSSLINELRGMDWNHKGELSTFV
jgi:dephospho-CoA kinase